VLERLRELGRTGGQNLVIERADAEGRTALLTELAAASIAKGTDAIWTWNPEAAIAVARATKTIALAFWSVPFLLEQGLIDSLAPPGWLSSPASNLLQSDWISKLVLSRADR
jgi:hypothetical protein